MDKRQKWFFAALVAGAGAYWLVDANESIRSALAVLTFFVFALTGESEVDKEVLRETNHRLWDEIRELRAMIDKLELDVAAQEDKNDQ